MIQHLIWLYGQCALQKIYEVSWHSGCCTMGHRDSLLEGDSLGHLRCGRMAMRRGKHTGSGRKESGNSSVIVGTCLQRIGITFPLDRWMTSRTPMHVVTSAEHPQWAEVDNVKAKMICCGKHSAAVYCGFFMGRLRQEAGEWLIHRIKQILQTSCFKHHASNIMLQTSYWHSDLHQAYIQV